MGSLELPDIWSSLSSALAADARVSRVWLGGSYAAGRADEFSDIDLAIDASPDWEPSSLGELWLGGQSFAMDGVPFFHGVLRDGTILDVMVRSSPDDRYVALPLDAPRAPEPCAPEPQGAALDFWINSHKHRKVLGRGLGAMATIGLHHDRLFLLRLWALADTGEEPPARALTIFGLTDLIRSHVTRDRRRVFGMPTRSDEETIDAIEALRDEVASVGRFAFERYGVPYPFRLEAAVRRLPLRV